MQLDSLADLLMACWSLCQSLFERGWESNLYHYDPRSETCRCRCSKKKEYIFTVSYRLFLLLYKLGVLLLCWKRPQDLGIYGKGVLLTYERMTCMSPKDLLSRGPLAGLGSALLTLWKSLVWSWTTTWRQNKFCSGRLTQFNWKAKKRQRFFFFSK